jgi:hypothetical protein
MTVSTTKYIVFGTGDANVVVAVGVAPLAEVRLCRVRVVERVVVSGCQLHIDSSLIGLTQPVVKSDFKHGRTEGIVEFGCRQQL